MSKMQPRSIRLASACPPSSRYQHGNGLLRRVKVVAKWCDDAGIGGNTLCGPEDIHHIHQLPGLPSQWSRVVDNLGRGFVRAGKRKAGRPALADLAAAETVRITIFVSGVRAAACLAEEADYALRAR